MGKKYWRLSGVLAALLLSSAGCQWKGGPAAASGRQRDVWRAVPATMRIYPSTRLATQEAVTLLEARIELLDEMGDSVKGVGDFHFELFTVGKSGGAPTSERLYAWDVAVQTLPQQRQFFDGVTRAYLFRLRLDGPLDARHDTVLRVMLSTPDGKRISTEAPISSGS